jgi:hypothetical protein
VGEAVRITKSTTGFSGIISQSRRYIFERVLALRRTVCCRNRSICRSLLSARLDLAESLPVTQIAKGSLRFRDLSHIESRTTN